MPTLKGWRFPSEELWGVRRDPAASGLAAGFFFSGRWNQFAATRIALAWKIGTPPFRTLTLPLSITPAPPVGQGFFPFCIARCRALYGLANGSAQLFPPPALRECRHSGPPGLQRSPA